MELKNVFIVILFYVQISLQFSIKSDDYYTAAVVEFKINSANNLWKDYFNIISEASEKDVDIIIFPEGDTNINKTIKVPFNGILKNDSVPALRPDLYDEALVLMSEAARKYSIYVMVNLHEVLDCVVDSSEDICPDSKSYVFNSNVVFDRTGAVIARYRKYNLYAEPNITAAFEPEVTIIDTDFGVQFGIITCFDILNKDPFMGLINKGIKNILVDSNWVNELPFITAVQTFESIAYGLDINLLVAGQNDVTDLASGSGIFSGRGGTLTSFITGVPTTKLLIAKVPKDPSNTQKGSGPIKQNPAYFDGLITIKDKSLPSHMSKLLVSGNQTISMKFNDISCNFNITMKERNGEKRYKYRAGVFSGVRTIQDQAIVGTRDCAIFICSGDTIESCGERFIPYIDNATAIFEELSIEASVSTPKRSLSGVLDSTFYPTSLDVYMLPLEPTDFEYEVQRNDKTSLHKLTLKNQESQLYSFGLWGRIFDKDGGEITPKFEEEAKEVGKLIEIEMNKINKHLEEARERVLGDSFV